MKRALLLFFGVSLLALAAGCANHHAGRADCEGSCPPAAGHAGHAGLCPAHGAACGGRCGHGQAQTPPPPLGQVAYPYYTTRGPRDFLQRNPSPIGP